MKFLDLPVELHRHLSDHLDQPNLLSLSLLSKTSHGIYSAALASHLRLDGTEELLNFLAKNSNDKVIAARQYMIRHIELYEPGVVFRGAQEQRVNLLISQIPPALVCEFNGGPIGSVLSLCPNVLSVKVLQTPLAFTSLLASVFPYRIRDLTFHSPHVDASALGHLVTRLPSLHTLDVSGVKTCGCQGHHGALQGRADLASALRESKVTRLVLTSSKVVGGDFFALLQGSMIQSLEVRRSPVRGVALASFLEGAELSHLFVGGCKRVRARHLCSLKCRCELEVDGRLISKEMLPETIMRLRVYQPCLADLQVLADAIRSGQLPRLSELIILPSREHDITHFTDTLNTHGRPGASLTTSDTFWYSIRI